MMKDESVSPWEFQCFDFPSLICEGSGRGKCTLVVRWNQESKETRNRETRKGMEWEGPANLLRAMGGGSGVWPPSDLRLGEVGGGGPGCWCGVSPRSPLPP